MRSITLKDVIVEYRIYDVQTRSLRHRLGVGALARTMSRMKAQRLGIGGQIESGQRTGTVIRALNGVNLALAEGDRVGLVGHNGSGKTTMLRTLAGIYEPAAGKVEIEGKVTPLFDFNLGIDHDATGLENIWLRGRLLGLSHEQISERLDDIVDFSELGNFLFMPVRTYSAGMMLRLAFSISTAIQPEILLLDEMIGGGDASFMDRARERLSSFIETTGILVIASHDPGVLRRWCNKGLMLEHGNLVALGPLEDVLSRYKGGTVA